MINSKEIKKYLKIMMNRTKKKSFFFQKVLFECICNDRKNSFLFKVKEENK